MTKTLDFFVNAVNHLESEMLSAEMYFNRSVLELIEIMQDKNEDGCVTFDDYSAYPSFFDFTKDISEIILAVRVTRDEDDHLTIEGKTENDDEWFKLHTYGRIDMSDLYSCLKSVLHKE